MQTIKRPFKEVQSDVYFGCALKTPGFSGLTESYFRLEDTAGTTILSISITSAGTITITAGGFANTSLFALDNIQWNYIECHYIAKDTAGAGGIAECRVNGVLVVELDGVAQRTTTEASDDIKTLGIMDNGTNSPRYLMDDLYVLNGSGNENNTYLGDVRITALYPRDDGGRNEWSAAGSGSNFQEVKEVGVIDSNTFVESGLIGAAEDYDNQSFAEIQLAAGTIFGVQVCNATLRTASGSIEYKNEMVVAGARFSDDIEYNPGNGDYFVTTYVRDTDPSDGLGWTEDKVAAVGSGIVITAKETI
jgi:hypothetical protein